MHRFYLPPGNTAGSQFSLTGGEARHAFQVLRLRPGQRVSVLDGAGQEFVCEINSISKHDVGLTVLETKRSERPACQISLFQAVPKGKAFEAILQKATELGVTRIVPLLTERVALQTENPSEKAQRWNQIVVEAMKQCGQRWLPQVSVPVSIANALMEDQHTELSIVASLEPDRQSAFQVFQEFFRKNQSCSRSSLWIGPEGDFTSAEMALIKSEGVLPISLGELVLRCETAAVSALSILKYEVERNR